MSRIIECITNPNCEKVIECEEKIDCTMAVERGNGLTRYVCGITPCQYSQKGISDKCET